MLLRGSHAKPVKKSGLRTEAGELAGGRMENNIDALAVSLTLNKGEGEIKIKMLALYVGKLMLQGLLLTGRREGRIDIDIKAAVIIGKDNTLHRQRESDKTNIVINHRGAAPR